MAAVNCYFSYFPPNLNRSYLRKASKARINLKKNENNPWRVTTLGRHIKKIGVYDRYPKKSGNAYPIFMHFKLSDCGVNIYLFLILQGI